MNKRTESLVITLTAEEKQYIKKSAESAFLSISDFVVLSSLAFIPKCYLQNSDASINLQTCDGCTSDNARRVG